MRSRDWASTVVPDRRPRPGRIARLSALLVVVAAGCAPATSVTPGASPTIRPAVSTSIPSPSATLLLPPSDLPTTSPQPTPTASPAPWWVAFASQATPIDQVPLMTDINGFPAGSIGTGAWGVAPYFQMWQADSTVTAIVADRAHGILWIALTNGDKGMTRIKYRYGCDGIFPGVRGQWVCASKPDTIEGSATLWWGVTDHTAIWNGVANVFGLQNLVGRIRVGMTMLLARAWFGAGYAKGRISGFDAPGWSISGAEASQNIASWAHLRQSVGHAYSRSDRRFAFYPVQVEITLHAPAASPST